MYRHIWISVRSAKQLNCQSDCYWYCCLCLFNVAIFHLVYFSKWWLGYANKCNITTVSFSGAGRINDCTMQSGRRRPRRAAAWPFLTADIGCCGGWCQATRRWRSWTWRIGDFGTFTRGCECQAELSCQCLFERAAKTETGHFSGYRDERSIHEEQLSVKPLQPGRFQRSIV